MCSRHLLHLPLGECITTFNLEDAVCNHGFFMMAPNSWIPSTKTLQRPLRLANSTTSVMVSISHPPNNSSILIQVHDIQNISLEDEKAILKQVGRMLRISEGDERNVREFQNMHPEAKKRGFGRLFRSPTLFEDAVKSILLCHCTWTRTLDMARALCELQAELVDGWNSEIIVKHPKKKRLKRKKFARKQSKVNKCEDESCSNSQLLEEGGKLKLKFKKTSSYEEIFDKLSKIKGFGPYACATLMMCIGFYQMVPMDTETKRHLQQVYKTKKENAKEDVKRIYDKYAPFQALSFWLELLEYYEIKFGKLSMLPNSSYHIVTGS
ncbi:hypothetical protein RGQ29_000083 [Quercus rubra]|uniref:DNA glycosylase n=1 Tax=Quercus rubra TaxID=3512 RepID=A0AAN7JBT4_QUERU|nr:hypothetical protein RGQ29_000083 [Quercus rubra]